MNSTYAALLRRSFSTSTKNKTAFYIWTLMPRVGPKATELKQQLAIPKGIPTRVPAFDGLNIQKILIGIRHSAALSGDGKLYMFGSGNWGVLGQGTETDARYDSPKLVEYFVKKDRKVVDVAVGEYHSVALTDDGSVYTWGYAGKVGLFNWMYSQEVGALGHGDKKPHFLPKKVDYFDKHGIRIKKIHAGMYHTLAISTDDQVYTWGRGLYGVLGNGSNNYALEPELNDELEFMRKENPQDKTVVKVDTADEYTAALMADGTLYTWGKNDRGQMGLGSGIGIDMVESENIPREVPLIDEKAKQQHSVTDFHCGQNTMLFRDELGGIYKSGLKIDYTPKKINLLDEFAEADAIEGMTCGRRHYVLWNKNNQLAVWGNVFKDKPQGERDGFGLYFGNDLFNGGKVRHLCMKYQIFGALVEEKESV